MADSKLVDLIEATSLADTDLFYVSSGGVSKKITADKLAQNPITTPAITTPVTGAVDFIGTVTKSAFATSSSYAGALDFAHWQLSYTSDFANIEIESTVGNLTTWTPSVGLPLQLCYIRVKDGSDGHRSGWSETVSFTTPNIYVGTPTLTVTGEPSDVPETPTLTTSAFSVYNGSDTHAGTTFTVKDGGTTVWTETKTTGDLLTTTVPAGILEVSKEYTFEAYHTGVTYGNSGIVVNTATTLSAFAYDNYLAVAHTTSPYTTIYGNDIDTSTKLANPATLPTDYGQGVAFSADGTYMAVAHNISPYITIYKRSGDTFTKLANPATLPTGIGRGVAFSADGVYMAVAHNISPYITIYKRSGDTFTKLANPATLPAGIGRGVAFSADGVYMAVAHDISPFIAIYKRSGDVFTKLETPATLPTGIGYGVAFSADGIYMAVAHVTSPYVTIYKRSGDTFTKLTNPATLPTGTGLGVAYYPRAFEGVL